jgi:anti-sigma factor ChrR (cupin superfamily)
MYSNRRSTLRPAHALALAFALALALALATLPQAHAQSRTFPSNTKLGALEITVFPRATLDEKPIVMAPGVRILNESNLIQLPSTVRGVRAARYRTDMLGQVIEVWLLTPQELAVAQDEARRAAAARQ